MVVIDVKKRCELNHALNNFVLLQKESMILRDLN